MYILIDKKTKEIKSFSTGEIEYDQDIFVMQKVKDEELQGYQSKFIDGKIEKEEIQKSKEIISEDIKQQVESAKSIIDLKNIIYKLI